MKTTTTLALAALVLVGCGADQTPTPDYWTPGGIGIKVEPGAAEWAQAPDLGERVDAIAQAVADYAGRPVTDLGGVVVVIRAFVTVDAGQYGQRTGRALDQGWIEMGSAAPWVQCVEASVLSHEMFHILLGNEPVLHGSALWCNLSDAIAPLVQVGCEFRPWTIDANAG
jgi:hypothetical protein